MRTAPEIFWCGDEWCGATSIKHWTQPTRWWKPSTKPDLLSTPTSSPRRDSRNESIVSTTKRHPARMRLRGGCSKEGKLLALDFAADFNTGAYSSWGPTVSARVPVHASGPYYVPH